MAQGENASKNNVGKDWWGKRPLRYTPVSVNKGMKFFKRQLHKIERQNAKRFLRGDSDHHQDL